MAIEITTNYISTAVAEKPAPFSISFGTPRVTARDRKFFTEQLALLLETGNSLASSLEIIARQTENISLTKIIDDISGQISSGKSFSQALALHPQVFSTTYVTLINASEEGGYMDNVLKHILDMEEKRENLQNTLTSAFTYPAFLIVFAGAVILFILAYVFPKFAELFESIHDELPAITLVLMWLSDITRNYWWALVGGIVAVIGLVLWWIGQPNGLQKINDLTTHIPLIGNLILQIYLIQTMRMIGLSLENGVSLVDAIAACSDVVKNSRFIKFIDNVNQNVIEGRGFSSGFNETDFIPPLVRQMVQTGEESGQLALVTSRIADYYQRDLSRRLENLSKMIEPVMLLVMGVVVGLIVSSLILPIFKLSRAVH